MVSQSEWNLINEILVSNEGRLARSREFVGVLFFILALEMFQVALICGALQAYALPLRRFGRFNPNLINNQVSTGVHTAVCVGLYFLITGTAGASGYIFMSCFIGLWMTILLVFIAIRKILALREGPPKEREGHRKSIDNSQAQSFDFGDTEGPSFDQTSQNESGVFGGNKSPADGGLTRNKRRLLRLQGNWTASPEPMHISQLVYLLVLVAGAVVIMCIFIGVFFGWKVDDYKLVDNNKLTVEYQPELNGKSLQMLYAFPTISSKFQMQLYVKLFTEFCGTQYSKKPTDKKVSIYDSWIKPYSINMSQYIPSDFNAYATVDEWFVRKIDLSLRPLPSSETAIVSPADCRILVFNQEADMLFYLKGYPVSVGTLLNFFQLGGYPDYFDNAAVAVARLAPQDYHRFHSPVAGTVVSITRLSGTYWSVSADAARSGNDAFLNTRTVIVIDAGPRIGFVAYVGVGATCVGSVRLDADIPVTVGSQIDRGQVLGSMHFGGSTVIMLFSKGRILFDHILLQRSRFGVETLVKVNSEIGASR